MKNMLGFHFFLTYLKMLGLNPQHQFFFVQ